LIGPSWGGAMIVSGTKRFFKIGQALFLFFKSYMTYIYLQIIDFPKFDLLTATGMALCVNLVPKCRILFPFFSDSAESSLA